MTNHIYSILATSQIQVIDNKNTSTEKDSFKNKLNDAIDAIAPIQPVDKSSQVNNNKSTSAQIAYQKAVFIPNWAMANLVSTED